MAVAETTVEQKATITVYDLLHEGAKKRKVLSNAELQSTEFNSIAFSPDSKYLAAQESVFTAEILWHIRLRRFDFFGYQMA